jgi:hypothetical protein
MPKLRYRKRQLLAFFRFTINANHSFRLGKWETAQEKIVYQTEDRGVHADTERQREYRERSEPGRFAELAQSEFEIIHIIRRAALELD